MREGERDLQPACEVSGAAGPHRAARLSRVPMILLDDYPQLALIAWNRKVRVVSEEEALALYEGNPQWVDRAGMTPRERAFLDGLLARAMQGEARG